jgi:hypothetical protein
MPWQIPVECTGIQTGQMEGALVAFELIPQGTKKNFPHDIQPNLDQRSSFDQQDHSLILIHRDSLYRIVDLQGDTSQPPRLNFSCERAVSMSAGLALVDSNKFNGNFQ